MLSALAPAITPRTNTKEFMVPADEPILRYRQRVRSWEARGWRIDGAALTAAGQHQAFAVPSPGRRENSDWLLDLVPLLPVRSQDPALGTSPDSGADAGRTPSA